MHCHCEGALRELLHGCFIQQASAGFQQGSRFWASCFQDVNKHEQAPWRGWYGPALVLSTCVCRHRYSGLCPEKSVPRPMQACVHSSTCNPEHPRPNQLLMSPALHISHAGLKLLVSVRSACWVGWLQHQGPPWLSKCIASPNCALWQRLAV